MTQEQTDPEAAGTTFRGEAATERPDPDMPGGIPLFLAAVGFLAVIRVALGYIAFPIEWLGALNPFVAVIFLSVPIVALFFAANAHWTWKPAALFVAFGMGAQAAIVLASYFLRFPGPVEGVLIAIAQAALGCWCAGLGALLATLIREKNIILPIAIFLAAFDFFLVLTPWGYGERLMKAAQPIFTRVAAQIPAATSHPTNGLASPNAYVGHGGPRLLRDVLHRPLPVQDADPSDVVRGVARAGRVPADRPVLRQLLTLRFSPVGASCDGSYRAGGAHRELERVQANQGREACDRRSRGLRGRLPHVRGNAAKVAS